MSGVAEISPKYLAEVASNAIRSGYKQTEVGVIPEDWFIEPLEEFTSFISYGFTNPMPTTHVGPYMITARDISDGKIQYKNARTTDIDAFNKLLTSKSRPKKNDLLLTKDGTLGRLALVEDEQICINQSVAILRPNQRIVPLFFKLLLESPYYQERMIEEAGGSTIKHIYITIVNRMPLSVPRDTKEQTAIANALSDVDALISELEKLIAKKQAIKTATMQQLLTGRTRLPQFALREDGTSKGTKPSELGDVPEDWEVVTLGDIAEVRMCKRILSYQTAKNGEIPFFKIGTFGGEPDAYISKSLYREFKAKFSYPEKGDVLISAAGTLGKMVVYDGSPSYFQDSNIVWLEIDKRKISNEYLYQYYKVIKWASSEGSTISRLYNGIIKASVIGIPTLAEQTAIATILSDMDAEIQALEQRLNKTRQIKQGMMQELLTGKTRLVKPECAA